MMCYGASLLCAPLGCFRIAHNHLRIVKYNVSMGDNYVPWQATEECAYGQPGCVGFFCAPCVLPFHLKVYRKNIAEYRDRANYRTPVDLDCCESFFNDPDCCGLPGYPACCCTGNCCSYVGSRSYPCGVPRNLRSKRTKDREIEMQTQDQQPESDSEDELEFVRGGVTMSHLQDVGSNVRGQTPDVVM